MHVRGMCDSLSVVVLCIITFAVAITTENPSKRVCVIGAGIAGLTTSRYLKEEGITFTVLEVTQYVGGTWRYEPRIGKDENGATLHTSMYKDLRTNLPKPTMELRGFPLPKDLPSFPSGQAYYQYLNNYAQHFDLKKHIQFLHNVILVKREDNVWKVKHQHVKTGELFEEEYDFVVVGNGHFTKAIMPNIPGEDVFKGSIIHSHDFRVHNPYKDRRVLIVGAGPSGMDIAVQLKDVAKRIIHSHHSKINFRTVWPSNYIHKQDIKELKEEGVLFVDGSYEEVDDIIYCTGFSYDYPFLDESSGLTITSKNVIPLYKHMVNINQPSMLILGVVVRACLAVSLDAQARYVTSLIKGNFSLPSREKMMQDWQKNVDSMRSKGQPMSLLHVLAEKEDQYYAELSEESGIEKVPSVMFNIRAVDTEAKIESFITFRDYAYTVHDDNTFTRTLEIPAVNNSLAP